MSFTSEPSGRGSDHGQHQPAVRRAELGAAAFFWRTQARTSCGESMMSTSNVSGLWSRWCSSTSARIEQGICRLQIFSRSITPELRPEIVHDRSPDAETRSNLQHLLRITRLVRLNDLILVHEQHGHLGGADNLLQLRDFWPPRSDHLGLRFRAQPVRLVHDDPSTELSGCSQKKSVNRTQGEQIRPEQPPQSMREGSRPRNQIVVNFCLIACPNASSATTDLPVPGRRSPG